MKKILITGGTGFIGRNLKEQLASKYLVDAPTYEQLNLLDEDKVSEYLKTYCFDVVIHSATWNATKNSSKDLSKVLFNNLRMFFNLARCSHDYGKMIYYGSGAEYDKRYYLPKMTEDYFDAHVPVDDYGFSKYIMSKHINNFSNIYNLRLFAVFGKYEDWEIRFISNACCKAVWDLPITIKQNVFFDYMYIDDLMQITEWFIRNNPKENCYNVCTGGIFALKTLAYKVLAASEKNLDIIINRKDLGKEYSGDNSRLLSEMGGYYFRDMDICIKELYEWYLTNKDSINRQKLILAP